MRVSMTAFNVQNELRFCAVVMTRAALTDAMITGVAVFSRN